MTAYIVVAGEPGKSCDVARQIASLPGVKMADGVGAPATYSPWLRFQNPRSSTN